MIQSSENWETEEEDTIEGSIKLTRDFRRPAYYGTSIEQSQIGRHKYR